MYCTRVKEGRKGGGEVGLGDVDGRGRGNTMWGGGFKFSRCLRPQTLQVTHTFLVDVLVREEFNMGLTAPSKK